MSRLAFYSNSKKKGMHFWKTKGSKFDILTLQISQCEKNAVHFLIKFSTYIQEKIMFKTYIGCHDGA